MSELKHTPEPWEVNHWHNNGSTGVTCHGKSDDGISHFTGDAVQYPHFNIVAKVEHHQHDVQGSFEGAHIAEVLVVSDQSRDNALRIVECVNACAGIDNPSQFISVAKQYPEFENNLKSEMRILDEQATEYRLKLADVETQRDELLAAMEDAVSWFKQLQDWSGVGDPNLDQYIAAIAKAKGGI